MGLSGWAYGAMEMGPWGHGPMGPGPGPRGGAGLGPWIIAIQIEKQKERIKYLKESNELYYNALKFENSDVINTCCEHHPNAVIDPETGKLV